MSGVGRELGVAEQDLLGRRRRTCRRPPVTRARASRRHAPRTRRRSPRHPRRRRGRAPGGARRHGAGSCRACAPSRRGCAGIRRAAPRRRADRRRRAAPGRSVNAWRCGRRRGAAAASGGLRLPGRASRRRSPLREARGGHGCDGQRRDVEAGRQRRLGQRRRAPSSSPASRSSSDHTRRRRRSTAPPDTRDALLHEDARERLLAPSEHRHAAGQHAVLDRRGLVVDAHVVDGHAALGDRAPAPR